MHRLLLLLGSVTLATCFDLPPYKDLEDPTITTTTTQDGDLVYVEVAQGVLIGIEKSHLNYTYHSFQSIPYAKPPTGTLRFKNPEPADAWIGELNATMPPPLCPQLIVEGQEDCLYLNVYTPKDSIGRPEPLPVMVWIHGGGFYIGGSRQYTGVQPLLQHDVIIVSMNYRLGVLGFLSTEDDAAPGNLGLKDQTLALRWVKENIAVFGGDPERVTLFGQSAGAASVHYQILTPEAAGLFSGAIIESGSSFTSWSRGRDFSRVAKEVGEKFHCPTEESEEMITCLQSKNAHLIDEKYAEFIDFNFQPFYFGPRIDGQYIPSEPATLVKEGRYNHVPVMTGINRNEGSLVAGEMYWDRLIIDALVDNFPKNGPPTLELHPDEDPVNTSQAVYDYYLGGLNFEFEDADNLAKLYTDRFFSIPFDWLTKLIADVDEVYTYEMRYKGEHTYLDKFPGLNQTLKDKWICHSDDVQYIFDPSKIGELSTPEDLFVSDLFTTMWTNFVKTRNPTPDDSLGFIWDKTNAQDLSHLVINSDVPYQMEKDTRSTERQFWDALPLRINDILQS